jgi:photosystem II stability/assembly factor-like uncharacterized protein
MTSRLFAPLLAALVLAAPLSAQKKAENAYWLPESALGGLSLRNIGPAVTSGRIADFAVNPENPYEYYVAVASGGVWKTSNNGTTYAPIFDGQGSYSIGCVALDPSNPHVVWVGTGENNAQRSVGYGDGVYRSQDGGASWEHVGLKHSEHIGKIVVHPTNSQIVYVAAQGPLWKEGGERGLYKTTDGGKTWNRVLHVSDHTGISDLAMDPRNPDVLYASAWQRRRHVFTFISGGPESALYKSTDGGQTWQQLKSGLPSVDLGRIGLAISPANPDYVYAIVEAADGKGGFFRSSNRGASWEKRSGYSSSGNYYQEIICDPVDPDKVYSMNTWSRMTADGGKTFGPFGDALKHVDHHAIWIDPKNTAHFMIGCDGGIYETYDNGTNWHFKANLPVTQFYKVAVDQAEPFYHVYGGTQDNFSLGGPSRTTNAAGIVNADWFVTNGGDGFESQVDPDNPNIVYAQAQYGWLVRYDKKSGESLFIQPQPKEGEAAYRWNWDAPLLISPHSGTRLYFAANKLFRSDDRGNTWRAVSGDLSRQLDRNKLPVMGQVWGMDAVAKNASTSIYGNIVALDESPKQEGLLYVGTDDGLVQVSEDAGASWRKQESFPGVPDRTYVNCLLASQHDAQVVYAAFNNHKNGDFAPYLYKSTDRGRSWSKLSKGLPERGSVYSIAEDHVDPKLLFAGTEFGLFVSVDGGEQWMPLNAGLPTIAVRDLAIQRRENDLVLATFGRGFYVLDNYAPLRELSPDVLAKEAHIFAVKDAWMFIESMPLGLRGKAFQGASYYTAPNPEVGAVFTFYLKEELKTRKQRRQAREAELRKKGEPVPYPTPEEMRAEDAEEAPYLMLTVTDADGQVVRRLKSAAKAGTHRLAWDFRYPSTAPVSLQAQSDDDPFSDPDRGYLALPGTYRVSLAKVVDGQATELAGPQPFNIRLLNNATLPAADRQAVVAFQRKVSELRRLMAAAGSTHAQMAERVKYLKAAVMQAPGASAEWLQELNRLESQLQEWQRALYGDGSLARREFETLPGMVGRVETIVYGLWNTTTAPTATQQQDYDLAAKAFEPVLEGIKRMAEQDLPALEAKFEQAGAPWTPGRKLHWNRD